MLRKMLSYFTLPLLLLLSNSSGKFCTAIVGEKARKGRPELWKR